MGKGHGILIIFLLINVLIAYLGRWSIERRFRSGPGATDRNRR